MYKHNACHLYKYAVNYLQARHWPVQDWSRTRDRHSLEDWSRTGPGVLDEIMLVHDVICLLKMGK